MRPLRAWSMIREQPFYRREAFSAGLAGVGYQVHHANPHNEAVRAGEVLVIWNRYDVTHQVAERFEAKGGTVLVAENGYLGMDRNDRQIYAMSRHAHNGRGEWFPGGPERWEQLKKELGLQLQPMDHHRRGHVLVAPNRSFGMPGGVMPHDWAEVTARWLRRNWTDQEVRIRHHPGNVVSKVPLEDDLRGASSVWIWSSSVGVEALIRGIPVVCHAPWWICKDWERISRGVALQNLAWAQWKVSEIADGTAFRHLLRPAEQGQIAASA